MSVRAGMQTEVDPRYPIGDFKKPETVTPHMRMAAVATLAELPGRIAEAVGGLDRDQLNKPYREGGWTVRQVVHHVADSHMNALLRMKLALTEDWPTITAYNEKEWAKLHDAEAPVNWSVTLLHTVHARWVMLLESLMDEQWERGFKHPERGPSSIDQAAQLYAWHSRHHVAHITRLRELEGWQ
jgi:uncharacterized damage-inducible protein DinB